MRSIFFTLLRSKIDFFIYRLFFGGEKPVNIEGVRLIKTEQNFYSIISVICYFDTLLQDKSTNTTKEKRKDEKSHVGLKFTEKQIKLFTALFNKYAGKPTTKKFDPYIDATFSCFVESKTRIYINVGRYSQIKNLYMHPVLLQHHDHQYWTSESSDDPEVTLKPKINYDEDYRNLFKVELLRVFRNLKEIYITGLNSYDQYSKSSSMYYVSLYTLLRIIKHSSSLNEIRINDIGWGPYIEEFYDITPKMIERYGEENFTIKKDMVKRRAVIIIQRKN